ncbi:hypothetical protein AURDEDRAFT_113619 [Auricularia subglabra TFB-10046 SS5]|nr:hypothetical protein AURDEDRAFT_113619 [Auricularia subglabra TFB-10046 SS5]
MELTCKVFLSPRLPFGAPDVMIWRTPTGLLLAAVPCACPGTGECRRHQASELLRRARAHHTLRAPQYPCRFTFEPQPGNYVRHLGEHVTLHTPITGAVPYPLESAIAVGIADPAYVVPDMEEIVYMPPHSYDDQTMSLEFRGSLNIYVVRR